MRKLAASDRNCGDHSLVNKYSSYDILRHYKLMLKTAASAFHWKRDMFRFLLVNTTILNSIYCGNGSEIFRFDVAHCQRRNSYELYPVRAGGTQTIGLPGGHPELSCPAALFI
jgi:hypothetical protein